LRGCQGFFANIFGLVQKNHRRQNYTTANRRCQGFFENIFEKYFQKTLAQTEKVGIMKPTQHKASKDG
jgi:hypothetical protein